MRGRDGRGGQACPFSEWPVVAIVASGPSLTVEQCEYLRKRREQGACRVLAINTSYQRVPWCDGIYATDRAWWKKYHAETPEDCEKVTGDTWAAQRYGLTHVTVRPGANLSAKSGTVCAGRNSGHQAIQWAVQRGARRVILVGYDMQHTGGRTHWHGDHPKGLTNAEGIAGWIEWFTPLAADLAREGVQVINCSEQTALHQFERGTLRDHL